jgi:hypothetical protein
MAQGFLLFLAFLIVLCIPSTNLQIFDGLPFSHLLEFAALALVAPFLLFSGLRSRHMDFWKRWNIRPAYLWILLAALLVLKVALYASGEHAGFTGCYRSLADPAAITHEELPFRECERSYENLFDRFSATRLDETIEFGPDGWNLVFLNTNRYDYYDWEKGNILRPRIPIEAHWSGYPDVGPDSSIRIEYIGEGTVVWGDVRAALPPAYGESNVVEVDPPGGESLLLLDYSFDDGSRSGQDPANWGPRAAIKVSAAEPGKTVPLAARNAAVGWRIAALLADVLILLWIIACLPGLWLSMRADLAGLIAFTIGIGLFSLIPAAPVVREIGITCVLAAALAAHILGRPFRTVSLYFIVVAAGFVLLRVWSSGAGQVLLRSAGNDALAYESQAYSILATGSWRGGESLFYNVPAYRYIKFLEHVLFGDGNTLYAGVQLAAFFGGVFALIRGREYRSSPAVRRALLTGLGCGLIFLGGYYVSAVIREGLSEYDTWTMLLWVLPGIYAAAPGAILTGAIALGISYTIRPNQIIGILWIFFIAALGSWKKKWKTVLLAGALALGIALLPLVHNLYFGRQWLLAATGGGVAVNLILLPATWLAFLQGDPAAGAVVREQIGMLFLVTDAPRSMWPTLALMAVFCVCWLGVSVYSIVRRKWSALPWLAIPIFYLAVHLVYGVSTYYPRHIVIGYLCMAITSVLVLKLGRPASPAAEAGAVELPR